MADGLSSLTTRLKAAMDTATGAFGRHAFWVALVVATIGVVGVAAVVGSSALIRAEEWRVRTGELLATREAAAMWRAEMVPASPAEEAAWRASEASVRERGIDPSDRLALLQEVAQRAEDLGISDVRVSFESADTLETTAVREVGEAVFEVAPWALAVGFMSDYGTAASLVGSLPPQVDVHRLRMFGLENGVETELVLLVFASEGS